MPELRAEQSETCVAIYHLSVKLIARGAGRSATAASAYRSGDRLSDERTGLVFDYTRKRGVEHTEIVLPQDVAESAGWARNREQLWNAAELAEKRKDARVAREYEVALPHELSRTQRLDLVRDFSKELATRYGCAVDFAIHAPHRQGDTRNHHAHILTTTRALTDSGLGAKTDIELKDADRRKKGLSAGRAEVTAIRERWAEICNAHLAEYDHASRIDHRSLAAQGIRDREPTWHKGPAVTAIERRGESARVTHRMAEEVTERLRIAAELGRLERESKELARSIIDTDTQLEAALAEREINPTRSVEQIRRDAQAAWLASRSTVTATDRTPPAAETTLDLTGDLVSVRRVARQQWLASRDAEKTHHATTTWAEDGAARDPPRLILPGSDLAK